MKIIRADNYDNPTVEEVLVCTNVNPIYAQHIVRLLNEKYGGENSPNYFRLVDDDYRLWRGMEDLI